MTTKDLLAIVVVGLCAAGGSAHADSLLSGTPTLTDWAAFQSTPLLFTRTAGTLVDNGAYGTATVSATLGADPSVSLQTNLEPFISDNICCTGGGSAASELVYYAEYVVPCVLPCTPSTAPTSVTITTTTSMTSLVDTSPFPQYQGFFPTVQTYLNVEGLCGLSCAVLNESSCLQNVSTTGCFIAGVGALTGALPTGSSTQTITLAENTPYIVNLSVFEQGIGPATALVDPTFAAPGGNGFFVFSSGIESADSTPEPSSWMTILIGIGLLAGIRRRLAR